MKKVILFIILIIFCSNFISSGSIGISPSSFRFFFEPGLEKTFNYGVTSSDPSQQIKIYVTGDLAEYVTISKDKFIGRGDFSVKIKLPSTIEKPGTHTILIGAIEDKEEMEGENIIGGIAAVQARIDIIVPYPGIYLEHTFNIGNINEKEKAQTEIKLDNLGLENLSVKATIKIYDQNETEVLINKEFEEIPLGSKESRVITEELDTEKFSPGEYKGILTLEYKGKTDKDSSQFKIGEFFIRIVDYSYLFEKGKINPFNIEVESKWNTKIDRVYATVSISDEGVILQRFETLSKELSPWEIKNLTGYIDATGLESKRYTASISVKYENSSTNKLVAIHIEEPSEKEVLPFIILGVVLLIALIAIILLTSKVRKLKHERKK
ncbi:MAG: hypothetical protein WC494_01755 [Candidatus Pacearchaeota archaeon]